MNATLPYLYEARDPRAREPTSVATIVAVAADSVTDTLATAVPPYWLVASTLTVYEMPR